VEQCKTWWGRGQGIGATYYQQQTELPDRKATCPDSAEVHSHVLQDVLLRVERTYQAFFRRIQQGETLGYPRFQGIPASRGRTAPAPSLFPRTVTSPRTAMAPCGMEAC